jgi:hypothetical protein
MISITLLVAAFVLLAALDEPSDPLSSLVLIFALLSLLAIALPVLGSSPDDGTPSPGIALLAAADAIGDGEDPRQIAKHLREVDVPEGRPRFCLDVALRCLEGAGRCDRLEGRLRREAAGWLRQADKEMR